MPDIWLRTSICRPEIRCAGSVTSHWPGPPSASCAFDVGDTLVLYTDGLVERRHESLDRGFQRLVDVVDELTRGPDPATPQRLCDALVERLVAPESSRDDVAVLVLRRVEPIVRGPSSEPIV